MAGNGWNWTEAGITKEFMRLMTEEARNDTPWVWRLDDLARFMV